MGCHRGGEKEVRKVWEPNLARNNRDETRQERREKKLKKKRERMPKHGKNLAKVYLDAMMKRLRGKGKKTAG